MVIMWETADKNKIYVATESISHDTENAAFWMLLANFVLYADVHKCI